MFWVKGGGATVGENGGVVGDGEMGVKKWGEISWAGLLECWMAKQLTHLTECLFWSVGVPL